MLTWISKAWSFAKSLSEVMRLAGEWQKIQLGAKDATIQAREAQVNVLDNRLFLEAQRSGHNRQPCVFRRCEVILLFALNEPEEEDYHTVFVDGLLLSPGSEDYKIPPRSETLEQLRRPCN